MKTPTKVIKTGRPQSAAKRQAILKAAGELFMEMGFAASLDRIAEAAGVSKQTVYGHFGSKEDLYREAGMHLLRSPIASFIDRRLPLPGALGKWGRDTLTMLLSDTLIATHRRLVEQAATFPEMAKVHAEFGHGLSVQVLMDYFSEQMTVGVLRAADPRVAAEDFLALLQGMSRLDRLFGHTDEPGAAAIGRHVDHTIEIFIRAYKPEKSSEEAVAKAPTLNTRKRPARPRAKDDS